MEGWGQTSQHPPACTKGVAVPPLLGDGAILCSFLNQKVIGGWNERVWSVTMRRG